MTLIPELRKELVATAARQAESGGPARGARRVRAWRPRAGQGGLAIVIGVVAALAVAGVALVALGHRPRLATPGRAPASLQALESRLAVLRRPPTAADRDLPRSLIPRGHVPVIGALTRQPLKITIPTVGVVRVFLLVHTLLAPTRGQRRADDVEAVAVDAHGRGQGGIVVTASMLSAPGSIGTGPFPRTGANVNRGVSLGIVPDGVTRVKWIFTGAGFGILHPHPITVYPRVQNNIAIAAVRPGEGPLARSVWYGGSSQIIASATGGTRARSQLQQITSVNTSRVVAIAPQLLSHYRLFRSVPADDLSRDPSLPFVGNQGLNYWQTRYIPSLRGLGGDGLWITPGTRELCISDPQVSSCGNLTSRSTQGFTGASTNDGHRETLSGLVPDGNSTVTLIMANGAHQTVPVIDNVYEATVPGQIVAIIARTTTGRIERRSLK